MTKIITIPEDVKINLQKLNIERDSRRDLILYIMERNDINISTERISAYQKEYDDKYFAFEQAKTQLEKEYVLPAVNNVANNWSLNYDTNEVTIITNE